jgi:hypothetical protein
MPAASAWVSVRVLRVFLTCALLAGRIVEVLEDDTILVVVERGGTTVDQELKLRFDIIHKRHRAFEDALE